MKNLQIIATGGTKYEREKLPNLLVSISYNPKLIIAVLDNVQKKSEYRDWRPKFDKISI